MARELLGHGKPQGPHGPQARPKAQSDRLEPGERKILGRAIERLSLGLTRERALVGQRYLDDPTLLAGYLLFYWPISYAQVCSLLGELPKPTTVLDLGSGPGPASFAMLDAGATRVLAADRSGPALAIAAKLASMRGVPLHTQRWKPDMPLPPGKFSMIVAQHLLNELWPGDEALVRRAALCRDLLGRLEPHGTLLLVEPALRDTSRELLQLRDVLVREGIAVRAPCLYRGDCQALDRPSDWCHAERDWTPPPLVLELAQAAGLRKERLKMSYLALAPPGEPWTEPPPGRLFRIVSEPLQGKGRLRYMACGPEGRMGLALQDKHVTDANRHFAALERGEIVSIEGAAAKGDGLGLDAASQVTRVAGPGERINDGRRPPRPGSES
jgi:SAM-dependent methyltransferase